MLYCNPSVSGPQGDGIIDVCSHVGSEDLNSASRWHSNDSYPVTCLPRLKSMQFYLEAIQLQIPGSYSVTVSCSHVTLVLCLW